MAKKNENYKYTLVRDRANKAYRIKALRSFGNVQKGDLGGIVDSYDNLDQTGSCWIDYTSSVRDRSCVIRNASIESGSYLTDMVVVGGNAVVRSSALFDNTCIVDDALVVGSELYKGCVISNKAQVHYCAFLSCTVSNQAVVRDIVTSDAKISAPIVLTIAPIVVRFPGLYPITAYDRWCQVGCKLHTIDQWEEHIKKKTYAQGFFKNPSHIDTRLMC